MEVSVRAMAVAYHDCVPPITNHKESVTKRVKKDEKDDRDNISELPDNVLLHIMSLMDTRSAVRTCVLSKRWKDVCKCLDTLTYLKIGNYSFTKFVSWVLSNRDDSCSLPNLFIDYYSRLDKLELLNTLIEYASSHNVEQLRLNLILDSPTFESLLPLIFCSQSLKSLQLNIKMMTNEMLRLPKSLHMPELKCLNLSNVRFTKHYNDYVEPFSKCRVLNILILRHCSLVNGEQILRISNSTLSNLKIIEGEAYQIELSTPNLKSFTMVGFVSRKLFSTCNLSFLEEVNIFIYRGGRRWDDKSSIIISWLQVLANVKILTFSLHAFRVILSGLSKPSSMIPQPPRFDRLETLHIQNLHTSHFVTCLSNEEVNKGVEYLLQNSPMSRAHVELKMLK